MNTISSENLLHHAQLIIDGTEPADPLLVTQGGEPLLLALKLDGSAPKAEWRLQLAATLFDQEQVSLGLAARIAGLTYREMVEELGQRDIDVIRLRPGELEEDIAAFDR